MLISGFCVLKNGVSLGYPFIESILSILPACDEFVVLECYSDDDTFYWLERLQKCYPNKIKLFREKWPTISKSGSAIGEMQTKALKLCKGRWCYLLQSDEIMPEENLSYLRDLCKPRSFLERLIGRRRFNSYYIDLMDILDNFQTIDTKFDANRQQIYGHRWAIRLVRNRPLIYSGGDGWQFQGLGCSLIGTARLPSPIIHVGYNFPVNTWRKQINHALLYPDFAHYQEQAREAEKNLADYQANMLSTLSTENPLKMPKLIAPMIGWMEYKVREELLNKSQTREG